MPTRIRLQRTGRKAQPSFRIVVTDRAIANGAPAIETIGTYNPRTQPSLIRLDTAAALNWLHEGAEPTHTVISIFKKTGVWEKYRAGVTSETLEETEAVVRLGSDPKTSRRAAAAAEGEKQAAKRRAEEKAEAEAAARKAAKEKAEAAKAAAEAAAAETAQAEADTAEEEAAAETDEEAPKAQVDGSDESEAEAEADADAEADAEADADADDEEDES